MKNLFIVANWKSNKTVKKAEEWIKEMAKRAKARSFGIGKWQMANGLEVILCPPFTLLYYLKLQVTSYKLQVKLGAQDISPFPEGKYTGAVSARMLKELVDYVIIGHSERRKYFRETEQILENKVREALDFNLLPIFCVQEKTTVVPEGVKIVAYEPPSAIGTGNPDTPENGNKIAFSFKERLGRETVVLYGGSVTSENVKGFCQQENLSGVLVGGASLDPKEFFEIVKNVSKI
ncbi:triosephosphate isomerase [Candidatus Gottesmanbacteria bacterium]|nr:triosephosphate isomerase [Candidatus Gottesmanbacteria bacterium]